MAIYPTYPHNISDKDLCHDVRGRAFFDDPMVELLCRRLEDLDGDYAEEVENLEARIDDFEQEVYDLKEELSKAQEDLLEAENTVDEREAELREVRNDLQAAHDQIVALQEQLGEQA